MEQDTFRRSICPCPKEFVGSTREHDRQGVTIKIRKRVADVRPGRGEGLDSIEISKTGRCLQTSTTYGFTKIANYIEDSVKTYDLRNEEEEKQTLFDFREFHRTTRVDNFIFEHAFKTTKNFDNLFFPRKLN
jgi:hypothetical protein